VATGWQGPRTLVGGDATAHHRDVDARSESLELGYDDCVALLRAETVGRIAVVVEPYPLVFPVNYRLVGLDDVLAEPGQLWIAIRTRPGNTIDRAPMFVSFEVDGVDRQHRTGWSVLVTGTMHRVDAAAAEFDARFDPEPWVSDGRNRWLVVHASAVTGRRVRDGDTGWAFSAQAYL
jgi:nitroimidazol reductase NimA-like FMN-containing flavoprotein (pyridoxamine 5'-phosphate oxidase superfamily)